MAVVTKEEIKTLREQGKTYREIAAMFSVSRQRIHQIYKNYRTLDPDGPIRQSILQRDNYECTVCGAKRNLHVHHIDGNTNNNYETNLATVCRKCHVRIDAAERQSGLRESEHKFKTEVRTCANCPVTFEFRPSSKKKYCSLACFARSQTLSPEERRHRRNQYMRKWHAAHPGYYKQHRNVERERKYYRQYFKRPEVLARIRQRFKDRYHNDPTFRQRQNEYSRRRYAKRKAQKAALLT